MIHPTIRAEAARVFARAANVLLASEGQGQRVTDDDIVITRKGGYTIIAIREKAAMPIVQICPK